MPACHPHPSINVSCRVRVGAETAPGPEVCTSHHSARPLANATLSRRPRNTALHSLRSRTDRCARLSHSRHFPSRTCDVDCMRAPAAARFHIGCHGTPVARYGAHARKRNGGSSEGERHADAKLCPRHSLTRPSHGHLPSLIANRITNTMSGSRTRSSASWHGFHRPSRSMLADDLF
jgi:hypothetical protein